MLSYTLAAAIWSVYGSGSIDIRRTYGSYDDCYSGAKMFFYGHFETPFNIDEGRDAELPGGIKFHWHCEGYVR